MPRSPVLSCPGMALWLSCSRGFTNYTAMALSPDSATLYVGAREVLLALDTSSFPPGPQHQRLLWGAEEEKKRQCIFKGKDPQRDCHNYIKILLQMNSTHLYTCGTSAFSPTCTYIVRTGRVLLEDGKGRCPFDPEYKSTAIIVDGELYTGTVSNFQGSEPTIFRSHGSRPAIKTEVSLNWLQGSHLHTFSAQTPSSWVYFFFSESGKEFNFFEDTIVSRIARVCKGDVGGERVLQRRWTTFLKAQLLCAPPEGGFPFNVLQDIFVLTPGGHWPQTTFYGVFTSQWGRRGAAVCAFPVADVRQAFNGLYKEVNRETQQWYTDTRPVMEPRPGAVRPSPSSLQMPDRVLNYLKDHFLMNSAVRSHPLLLCSRSRCRQISVQRVQGLHRAYDVLFLGTDDGWLQKAVVTRKAAHVVEEIQLFPAGQPVLELLLDDTQGLIYAASYAVLAQVPVANCTQHRSCAECILARDPHCAWSAGACRPSTRAHLRPLQQQEQQPLTRLPCPRLSNVASQHWVRAGGSLNSSLLVLPGGELLLVGLPGQTGRYECWSQEGHFRRRTASFCVELEAVQLAPARDPLETISASRSASPGAAGEPSALLEGKSYWTEFVVLCVLFSGTLALLASLLLHRHRGTFLRQGPCGLGEAPKAQPPAESLPLNGTGAPGALPDHRGYQALQESRGLGPPLQLGPGMAFLDSGQCPLSICASFVEVRAPSQRPRVRLGSEIRDSVV
uniref:Semaphorin 4B n=1 Tax=Varanus komodoensis TaxID=61221 RepID=A0A8D2LLL5_VARKO